MEKIRKNSVISDIDFVREIAGYWCRSDGEVEADLAVTLYKALMSIASKIAIGAEPKAAEPKADEPKADEPKAVEPAKAAESRLPYSELPYKDWAEFELKREGEFAIVYPARRGSFAHNRVPLPFSISHSRISGDRVTLGYTCPETETVKYKSLGYTRDEELAFICQRVIDLHTKMVAQHECEK